MRTNRCVALCVGLLLLSSASPALAGRIVAIGDVHGDLGAAREALRLAGAIDKNDHWVGGELVVVQTGDQLDRGDEEQAILDLFERLRGEAEAAGGAFHPLLGNHELMNAAGDLRYVTEGGYADFDDAVRFDADDPALAEFEPQQRGRMAALLPGRPYALRLATRSVILDLGDNIFVHGGVLPAHVEYGIDRINLEAQAWLRGEVEAAEILHDRDGPTWTRLYSDEPGEEACIAVTEVLRRLDAKRIIMGHTIQDDGIRSHCDAKIWCIDVGMAEAYGGSPQVLEIDGDELRVLKKE